MTDDPKTGAHRHFMWGWGAIHGLEVAREAWEHYVGNYNYTGADDAPAPTGGGEEP